tara:strand:- start:121 stop:819 length:699 start_codon:yes stop_codon:yes gene_type:complete
MAVYSSGVGAQGGIFAHGCSDNYRTELKEKQANEFQQQRFNNEINNERQNKKLPTLVTSRPGELKYIYLKSSCRQVAIRENDGALAVNIDQETGVKEDDDGNIIDGQFVDRSQTTPCSDDLLGIGQSQRAILKMRRKAEVLQYKNSNFNKKTRAQRYADAVRNRTKGTGASGQQNEDIGTNSNPNGYTRVGNTLKIDCTFNKTKYVNSSRSGVPGRKTLLFLDRNVTLREYL